MFLRYVVKAYSKKRNTDSADDVYGHWHGAGKGRGLAPRCVCYNSWMISILGIYQMRIFLVLYAKRILFP